MAIEWYKVTTYSLEIEPVEVVKFTDKTVTTLYKGRYSEAFERRYSRSSEWGKFFPTREEAVAYVRDRLLRRIENAKHELENATTKLANLK